MYWTNKGSPATIAIADQLLALINDVTPGHALKFNKHYIGLVRNGVADNFVLSHARKDYLLAGFRIPRSEDVSALIENSGIDSLPYNIQAGRYRVRLTNGDVDTHKDLLKELIRRASSTPAPLDDSASG
jgi:hypothetical protein